MYERLMTFLVCPSCRANLTLHAFERGAIGGEIEAGVLQCKAHHTYPIVGGIPRMLPDSLREHRKTLGMHLSHLHTLLSANERYDLERSIMGTVYDRRTKATFTHEWDSFDPTDGTWGMMPKNQTSSFFLNPLADVGQAALAGEGAVLLDAGCGPGLPSLEYARLGVEVIALDMSPGLEHGETLRRMENPSVRQRVHFVQADLLNSPVRFGVADIVSSLGVIHHTPNTREAFDCIVRALKPDGVLSVWVYSYERGVTEAINAMRMVTSRLPTEILAMAATVGALPFQAFCWFANKTRIRRYGSIGRRSARIALMDIFGPPYSHWHSYEELAGWFAAQGFSRVAKVAVSRRGFGAVGVRGVPRRDASTTGERQISMAAQ